MGIYALLSLFSLALLAAFTFFPYSEYRTDKCRQQLFALRDQLFDDAANGRIQFESAAYVATRQAFNGAIRFAHQISFARILSFHFLMRPGEMSGGFEAAIEAASPDERALCDAYIRELDVVVATYVMSSPFVLVLVIPGILLLAGIDVAGAVVDHCKKQFAQFNKIAFREGQA